MELQFRLLKQSEKGWLRNDMILKTISSGSQYGNCYAIINGEEILLLDCGCKYNEILKGIDYKISNVVGCLLTHKHGDHSKSYKEILNAGIPICTNMETANDIGIEKEKKTFIVPPNGIFLTGNFMISPFYVPHDGTANYAFIIILPNQELLLYATDFLYLPTNSFKEKTIDHFLIECNHLNNTPNEESAKYNHSMRGHSSLFTVEDIILRNKCEELKSVTLCHLSESWGNPEIMKSTIESLVPKTRVFVAESGLEVPLDFS